jgi:putative SOS response-associated peptidase YedK
MCNLYNISTTHEMMRQFAGAVDDLTNRLDPSEDIYPDKPAPVIRNRQGNRELAMLTWGMPSPSFVTKGKPDTGVTNIRNVASPHWRRWLGPENRCVVPWTQFCEWEDTKPKKTKRWFAIDDSKPLAFFAGIWTEWSGERGSMKNPRPGKHELFGFLTCEPNSVVKPIPGYQPAHHQWLDFEDHQGSRMWPAEPRLHPAGGEYRLASLLLHCP